jgi:mRNA-degrading endonuclease HigB of HigAB toxin-antitoxin module
VHHFFLAVNKMVPKWELGYYYEIRGQTEVAAFLASSPAYDNTVKAWVAEMKSGQWNSATALAADFQNVDVSASPRVNFYLAPSALLLGTLINFRIGIVMLLAIELSAAWHGPRAQPWNRAP